MRGIILGLISLIFLVAQVNGQENEIHGEVLSGSEPVAFATIFIKELSAGTSSDEEGKFTLKLTGKGPFTVQVSSIGYKTFQGFIQGSERSLTFQLEAIDSGLEEVVVSGTLQEVSKLSSPVPVEVYKSGFFKANPAPSLFESLQNVNGIRPQVNCNICNTGDIHINGLEGPYTMVLIDGMPIVSGLATVYGLTGIPQALIERIEVVKGPASTLYGSEAVGGLINVITKSPENAPYFSADYFGSSWGEQTLDLGLKSKWGKNIQSLTGINAFHYAHPIDKNGDGFTDLTLSERISVFQKLHISRPGNKSLNMAGRWVYEDRWGGEMNWNSKFRGGDEVYGESIYTNRWEVFGNYDLPGKENFTFQYSANGHKQNSVYGETFYKANQSIAFGQLTWRKEFSKNQFLAGLAYRYTYYDDNTPATYSGVEERNKASQIHLPGIFIQDEISLGDKQSLLIGGRLDYNSIHGSIFSPRLNYKFNSIDKSLVMRISVGNGFRVANVFTEDHAALTGAREVVFEEELKPEKSWNVNGNLVKKIYTLGGNFISLDATLFYTHFSNRIIPDYESNPNQIIYANLDGKAISKGISLNSTLALANGLEGSLGATVMDVSLEENGVSRRQLLTERISGVWSLSYKVWQWGLTLDYTGNIYSPMRLPLLGPLDDRAEFSPWWSIQNIQITKNIGKKWEIYGGVKNLLNFTPPANSIARAFDPFDRGVEFAEDGSVLPTPENPNALTFDPTYVFAPNQGIRGFLGFRFTISD
ncbi:TonB-dependent receptor [Algoriphagus sp. CAU 1675]|uniref:TonB-dependent receptor n=1 Tax=Algoriphagus sp. CAU 1675 TaxID=3032597 RepID=UPI0023DB7CB3|nr:TonB-dependent receptor [Algoriphagus sp. CAU 1675]MDF2157641.1 TonB-dependent receptor [Algoriphagus sp. CAU 1675]